MSKITSQFDLGKITDPAEFMRFCSQFISELQPTINGKLEFDANLATQTIADVSFPDADTNVAVKHKLGRTGLRYFVVKKNAPCDIYSGSITDTSDQIYLKSSVAGAKVTLVLL